METISNTEGRSIFGKLFLQEFPEWQLPKVQFR